MGGAQAVALLAYGGTDTDGAELAPVDMITGPGNIYVTAAKRLCRSQVGIDAEAGPTEIAILADHTADPGARGRRPDQPGRTRRDGRQRAGHPERGPGRRHRRRSGRPAADHRAPRTGDDRAGRTPIGDHPGRRPGRRHSRSSTPTPQNIWRSRPPTRRRWPAGYVRPEPIFVGPYSPVSLGDYCAGSNHVLPTAGTARHSSGLSVQTFLRGIHVVDYTEAALKDVSGTRGHAGQGRRPAGARRGGTAEVRAMTHPSSPPWTTCRCAMTCAANRPTAHRNWRFRCG